MEERRKPFKLLVHEASFSEDELLMGADHLRD